MNTYCLIIIKEFAETSVQNEIKFYDEEKKIQSTNAKRSSKWKQNRKISVKSYELRYISLSIILLQRQHLKKLASSCQEIEVVLNCVCLFVYLLFTLFCSVQFDLIPFQFFFVENIKHKNVNKSKLISIFYSLQNRWFFKVSSFIIRMKSSLIKNASFRITYTEALYYTNRPIWGKFEWLVIKMIRLKELALNREFIGWIFTPKHTHDEFDDGWWWQSWKSIMSQGS